MSRSGSRLGLLDQLHAGGCDGQEYSACRPVVVPAGAFNEPTYADHADRGADLVVVFMAWCGECGAADWEVV
jgi:hypothetical protein